MALLGILLRIAAYTYSSIQVKFLEPKSKKLKK